MNANAMTVQRSLSSYAMHPGALLAIRKGGRGVVRCVRGNVLVSFAGCVRDFTLAEGMQLVWADNPLVLIEAHDSACIEVASGATGTRPLWPWFGLGLLIAVVLTWGGSRVSGHAGHAGPAIHSACSVNACLEHAEDAQAWHTGKDLWGPGGPPATNRVISAYESACHGAP